MNFVKEEEEKDLLLYFFCFNNFFKNFNKK